MQIASRVLTRIWAVAYTAALALGTLASTARAQNAEETPDESVLGVLQITGDATGQVYQVDATFKLMDPMGKILLQGTAISRAPYNRFQEIFANVRARYDAENRAARTVADSIRTRIAAYLNTAA